MQFLLRQHTLGEISSKNEYKGSLLYLPNKKGKQKYFTHTFLIMFFSLNSKY